MCWYTRKVFKQPSASPLPVDVQQIDARQNMLTCASLSTPYEKQNQSLKDEMESFLCALLRSKSLFPTTLRDICRFLVWKDRNGKTQVHRDGCPYLGKHGVHPCTCPVRLSYSTFDSFISKLQVIFNAAGRQGEWESSLQLGNPASSSEVKSYLKAFTAEQLQARTTVKQPFPLFIIKLHSLERLISRKINCPGTSALEIYVLARDQPFLKTLFV